MPNDKARLQRIANRQKRRQAALSNSAAPQSLVSVEVWIPENRREELKALVAKWRDQVE